MRRWLDHLAEYSGLYSFIVSYTLLTVLGLIWFTIEGPKPLSLIGEGTSISINAAMLEVTKDPLFWLMVFSPFVALPIIMVLTRRAVRTIVPTVMRMLPEIPFPIFIGMSAIWWIYIVYAYTKADVLTVFLSAHNLTRSIEARYEIASHLGLGPFIVLLSILTFLAVYALTNAIRDRSISWALLAAAHASFLLVALVLLNRKWPVVLFILILAATVFLNAKRFRVLGSSILVAAGVVMYLLISVVVLRISPSAEAARSVAVDTLTTASVSENREPGALLFLSQAIRLAPALIEKAVKRKAAPVPYYYDMFSRRGPFCGSIIDGYFKTPGSCQPSHVVYSAMFPNDHRFKGTSPAAFHIYEFARGSWLGMTVALIIGGVIVGLFSALWPFVRDRPLAGAMMVMGIYAGYFLSQLPLEGAIAYYHGAAWWLVAVVLLNAALVAVYQWLIPPHPDTQFPR